MGQPVNKKRNVAQELMAGSNFKGLGFTNEEPEEMPKPKGGAKPMMGIPKKK